MGVKHVGEIEPRWAGLYTTVEFWTHWPSFISLRLPTVKNCFKRQFVECWTKVQVPFQSSNIFCKGEMAAAAAGGEGAEHYSRLQKRQFSNRYRPCCCWSCTCALASTYTRTFLCAWDAIIVRFRGKFFLTCWSNSNKMAIFLNGLKILIDADEFFFRIKF